jgi:anti-sigma regulatory factor (Ser/Thr protein kinase)
VSGKATTFKVASEPESVAAAREAVTDAAHGAVDAGAVETARLLVSELVTNSIVHGTAESPLELEVETSEAGLRVNVIDHGAGFARRPGTDNPDYSGGWGLFLVEELSDAWGIIRNGHTRVWFELRTGGGSR